MTRDWGVLRRRWLLGLIVSSVLLAVVTAAGWSYFSEERRLGRAVAAVLSRQTGLPVTVDRAASDGWRLLLRGVRVAPAGSFPLDVRAREIEVAGGLMPLIAPAGRTVSVVAMAASVSLVDAPAAGGDGDALRESLLRLLEWPGVLTLRLQDVELRSRDCAWRADLTGDKQAGGTLRLAIALAPAAGGERVAQVDVLAVRATPGVVDLRLDAAGEPARLGGLWADTLPVPARVAARIDARLTPGGAATVTARATGGESDPGTTVIDLAGSWDGKTRAVTISRYALARAPDIALQGTARTERSANGVMRLLATTGGDVAGSHLDARGSYELATGVLDLEGIAAPIDVLRLARLVGIEDMRTIAARRLAGRAHARLGGDPGLTVDGTVDGVTAPGLTSRPVDLVIAGVVGFGDDNRPRQLTNATVTVLDQRAPVAVVRGRSLGAALWPVSVDGEAADVARLAPFMPVAVDAAGSARIAGQLTRGERLGFTGELRADVARASTRTTVPLTLTDTRLVLPIRLGADDARAGSLTIARVSGAGLALDGVKGSPRLAGGRVIVPDLRYTQYGGRGDGWLELAVDGRAVPLRARLEAEGIDLATVVGALGTDVARVTGRVRYVATAQQSAHGLAGLVQLRSEGDGGQVDIDAIQRLLNSGVVDVDATGLVRQALESLRVFEYSSMDGELRLTGGTTRLDLSLKGRKRFGLFPGPVDAINVRNAPLDVLARTLGKGTRP